VNEDGESLALINDQGFPHDVEWFEHNSKSITEEINLGPSRAARSTGSSARST
jgi:hypothetical protein